jgi:hypothetical protein
MYNFHTLALGGNWDYGPLSREPHSFSFSRKKEYDAQ